MFKEFERLTWDGMFQIKNKKSRFKYKTNRLMTTLQYIWVRWGRDYWYDSNFRSTWKIVKYTVKNSSKDPILVRKLVCDELQENFGYAKAICTTPDSDI